MEIMAFEGKVTKEGASDFVPIPERIATFDNDGTLWAERPMYFRFFFVMDRLKALALQHPEWGKEPFASVLKEDLKRSICEWRKGRARQWAYDRASHIGELDEGTAKGWTIVNMKEDWAAIFPSQK